MTWRFALAPQGRRARHSWYLKAGKPVVELRKAPHLQGLERPGLRHQWCVAIIGSFEPTLFGFNEARKGLKPGDL